MNDNTHTTNTESTSTDVRPRASTKRKTCDFWPESLMLSVCCRFLLPAANCHVTIINPTGASSSQPRAAVYHRVPLICY